MQHDCFMWQIKKDKLVRTDKISAKSANLDKTLSKLMNEMPIEARKDIINTFFNILYETGAHTLSQLSENKLDIAMKTISAIRHMDEKSVAVMKPVSYTHLDVYKRQTQGLPRVEELFEARRPKGVAIISEIDGAVRCV